MRKIVCDIETDSLDAKVIWCIICKDLDTGELFKFIRKEDCPEEHLREFNEFTKSVSTYIGHNFLLFDMPVLNRLAGAEIQPEQVEDTLILGRFLRPGLENSLHRWGILLGFPKMENADFSRLSDKLIEYCTNDVQLNYKLYRYLQPRLARFSAHSLRLEHDHQLIMEQQRLDGFCFNKKGAEELRLKLMALKEEAEEQILKSLKPIVVRGEEVTPKATLKGEVHRQGVQKVHPEYKTVCDVGSTFQHIEFKEFDLNSPKQIVQRLEPYWNPWIRTKGAEEKLRLKDRGEITEQEFEEQTRYGWRVCNENLETLSEDAPSGLKRIRERLILKARIDLLDKLLAACGEDSRVRGRVISLGASTHRCAHREPNLANIPVREDSPYGAEIRRLFAVPEGETRLLGCDASGIQIRLLAHYLNDPTYTDIVIAGDKNDRSDVHSFNWRICFDKDPTYWVMDAERDKSKTNFYAWIFGAGVDRTGHILNIRRDEAKQVRSNLVSKTPNLKSFIYGVLRPAAKKGYFRAIDGRLIPITSEHKALSVALQSGEAIVMKEAQRKWRADADAEGLTHLLCAFVHDEWQTEVASHLAQRLGQLQTSAIRWAGELFELNCPLDGESRIGLNWKETH